jgi:hypothetical protein
VCTSIRGAGGGRTQLNVDLALLIAYVENYEARMGHGPSAVRVSYRQWANVVSLLTPTREALLIGVASDA